MKKVFETYWTIEKVDAKLDAMPWTRQRFFNQVAGRREEIIIPDDITHLDLVGLIGRKTRVTIEVID